MEDASEFLKLAGSVLLFVIALSVILPLFSEARQTADSLIAYSDRESEFYNGYAYLEGTKGEEKYFYNGTASSDSTNKVRSVGLDTIVPSIYRSYDENYTILFMIGQVDGRKEPGSLEFFEDLKPYYFYKKLDDDGKYEDSYIFDLNDFRIPKENVTEFIEAFLYGKFKKYVEYANDPQKGFQSTYDIKFDEDMNNEKTYAYVCMQSGIIKEGPTKTPNITGTGLYDRFSKFLQDGNEILEYTGIYYVDDVNRIKDAMEPGGRVEDPVPESMKDEKRIITYILNIKP